jgi:Cd2+/Zn2+-exporting ATPase
VEGTVVHVVIDGTYAGYIIIGDELKEDSVKAVEMLRKAGVQTVSMLTGDNTASAGKVAEELSLDSFYSGLLPEEKVLRFEEISSSKTHRGKVAFVGDGINDAPVIARADVGIAMGALGSDAAIETADVVLMTDHPSKVAQAIESGKRTRAIVWQNIIFALTVKVMFIGFGAVGLAGMWEAVFADMGMALIAVLNSSRALRVSEKTE